MTYERPKIYIRQSEFLKYNGSIPKGKKTFVVEVKNTADLVLGEIRFLGNWRKYIFAPKEDLIFDTKCLLDIAYTLDELTDSWRQNVKEN